MRKVIIYYTNNQLHKGIAGACREQLVKSAHGIPIICVTQESIDFGDLRIVICELPSNHQSMFLQIREGLIQALSHYQADYIFLAEHDMLYPEEYFSFNPTDPTIFYYDSHKYYMNQDGWRASGLLTLSTLVCSTRLLLAYLNLRLYRMINLDLEERGDMGRSEPGLGRGPQFGFAKTRKSLYPHLDIRHTRNLSTILEKAVTQSRIPHWDCHHEVLEKLDWNKINE